MDYYRSGRYFLGQSGSIQPDRPLLELCDRTCALSDQAQVTNKPGRPGSFADPCNFSHYFHPVFPGAEPDAVGSASRIIRKD